ncbi:MAG: RNA polymerase sigma factor [Terriglobales bacterium]
MMSNPEPIEAGELLQRLTLYAYGLFGCFPQAAVEPALQVSGKSPEDLAMDVLTRYFDPHDTRVAWDPNRGNVLSYLKTVLWHDFLDLKRAGLYRNAATTPESFDVLPSSGPSPEARLARAEQRERVLAALADEPELQAVVALQLDPEGWPGYTNQELAGRLSTTVAEIENRKKRLLRRLLKLGRVPAAATRM